MRERDVPGTSRQLLLLIMLVMGTLLHGYSMADLYIPAVMRALSAIVSIARRLF